MGYESVQEMFSRMAGEFNSQTAITRGIDVTKNPVSKNTAIHFRKRGGGKDRVFQSPNHALRLPSS